MRAAIDAAAEVFFGTPVSIEERVYQALSVETNMFSAPHETHVWRQLFHVVPSMATLYEVLGVQPIPIGWPPRPRLLHEYSPRLHHPTWWIPAFVRLFGVRTSGRDHEYTATARTIIATKTLTVERLVQSILECGQYSKRARGRSPNMILRRLATARGLADVHRPRSRTSRPP